MSYCVNCGVELAEAIKSCPLCGTPVYHPDRPEAAEGSEAYPRHIEHVYRGVDRRYGALLALIAMCVPVLCSFFVDIFTVHQIRWSLYATGGVVCLFVWVLLPLLLKRPNPYLHILYDTAALLLYLAGILAISDRMYAYLTLAAPLTLLCCAFAYSITPVIRSKRLHGSLYKPAVMLFISSVFYVAVEALVDVYTGLVFRPIWSLIAASSCIVTALMLIMIEGKQQLKDQIRRRLLL